jgi:hypothetical protein
MVMTDRDYLPNENKHTSALFMGARQVGDFYREQPARHHSAIIFSVLFKRGPDKALFSGGPV